MITAKDYVYEVYKERSFTLAAKKLFVSQPALSASIKKIEKELGAELFDRRTTPLTLTEAGKAYIEAAEQIYDAEENLRNRINDINELRTGTITIGGSNYIASCVLPEIISTFSASHPGITINLAEDNSTDLKERALAGSIDVVIDYDFAEESFTSLPLKEERLYLSASRNSAVAKELREFSLSHADIKRGNAESVPAINLKALENEKFILLKKGNDMAMHAHSMFKEAGISPKAFLELDQLMTSYALSRRGLGLAFVPDNLVAASPSDDAVFFRISSRYASRTLCIAYKKNRYVSKCLARFIEVAGECSKK